MLWWSTEHLSFVQIRLLLAIILTTCFDFVSLHLPHFQLFKNIYILQPLKGVSLQYVQKNKTKYKNW